MALSGGVLGPLISVAANATNPPAAALSVANWLAIATALTSHMQTNGKIVSAFVCPPTGGTVTGVGSLTGMDPTSLGVSLATAATTGNALAAAASVKIWTDVASAFVTYVQGSCVVLPGTLSGPPGNPTPGGTLTGAGTFSVIDGTALGDVMAVAAAQGNASVLAQIQSTWQAIGLATATHIMTSGQAGPGNLTAAPGGGPVLIGQGAIL